MSLITVEPNRFSWRCPQLAQPAIGAFYFDEQDRCKSFLMLHAGGISLPTAGKYERFDLGHECVQFVNAPAEDVVFENYAASTKTGILFDQNDRVIESSKMTVIMTAGSVVPSAFKWAIYLTAGVVVQNATLRANVSENGQRRMAEALAPLPQDCTFVHNASPRTALSKYLAKDGHSDGSASHPKKLAYHMTGSRSFSSRVECEYTFPEDGCLDNGVIYSLLMGEFVTPLPAGNDLSFSFLVPRVGNVIPPGANHSTVCPTLVFPNDAVVDSDSAVLATASGSMLATKCSMAVPRCMTDDVSGMNCVWEVGFTYSSKEPITGINMLMFTLKPDFVAHSPIFTTR